MRSAGSGVLNCMYCCLLAVGHFVWECEGLSRNRCTDCMYCCVLAVSHFVWECEGLSRNWRTELYVLLCVGSWIFCVGV